MFKGVNSIFLLVFKIIKNWIYFIKESYIIINLTVFDVSISYDMVLIFGSFLYYYYVYVDYNDIYM